MPEGGRDIRPARPGARDWKLDMPLSVCVRQVAPALSPSNPSPKDALEWPMDTFIPWFVRSVMNALEPGSSGASVNSLTESRRLEEP